jgi:hypothetical protein
MPRNAPECPSFARFGKTNPKAPSASSGMFNNVRRIQRKQEAQNEPTPGRDGCYSLSLNQL